MNIFIINLERQKEKIIPLLKQLNDFELSYNIFPAFDGKRVLNPTLLSLKRQYNVIRKNFEYSRHFSVGNLACTLSHLAIIKYAKMLNLDRILILEDDCVLSDDFLYRLTLLNEVPDDADIIYLGGIFTTPTIPEKYKISRNIYSTKMMEIYGTHAIIITKRGIDNIPPIIEEYTDLIDSTLMYASRTERIKGYALIPFCAYQREGVSDILNKYRDMDNTKVWYQNNIVAKHKLF